MSAGNRDKLGSGDLGRTISGNEETLSDASVIVPPLKLVILLSI
jgi:hypothetical protein